MAVSMTRAMMTGASRLAAEVAITQPTAMAIFFFSLTSSGARARAAEATVSRLSAVSGGLRA